MGDAAAFAVALAAADQQLQHQQQRRQAVEQRQQQLLQQRQDKAAKSLNRQLSVRSELQNRRISQQANLQREIALRLLAAAQRRDLLLSSKKCTPRTPCTSPRGLGTVMVEPMLAA